MIKYCGAGIIDADAALTNILTTGNGGGAMTASSATLQSSLNPAHERRVGHVHGAGDRHGTDRHGRVHRRRDGDPGCGAVVARPVQATRAPRSARLRRCRPGRTRSAPSSRPATTRTRLPTRRRSCRSSTPAVRCRRRRSSRRSLNPSAQGAAVTFTATVSGFAPTGSVLFRSDGVDDRRLRGGRADRQPGTAAPRSARRARSRPATTRSRASTAATRST